MESFNKELPPQETYSRKPLEKGDVSFIHYWSRLGKHCRYYVSIHNKEKEPYCLTCNGGYN